MKLVDKQKRFQFIKNQQVEIDRDLEKYQKLLVLEEVGPKNFEAIPANNNAPTPPEGDDSLSYAMRSASSISAVMPVTEAQRQDFIIQNVQRSIPDVDAELRKIVQEMKENGLREYLNSPDAKEFNRKFLTVLLAEVAHNGYSIQVGSRWETEYDTPLAYYSNNLTYGSTVDMAEGEGKKPSLGDRIKGFFQKQKEKKNAPKYDYTILQLFDMIHVEGERKQEFIDRVSGYFELLRNAATMHQKAQMDRICQRLIIDIYESVLAVHGYNKYITFGNIEQLQQKCEKVLDIDYIKNFARTIPAEVIEKKEFCDSLCVFDNYCVLYYDPTGASYKKEEKERRDPVLFGLINHSDRLYYIDSWIDEKCDLTLDQIAEKLGKKAIGDLDKDQKAVEKKADKILAKEAKQ